MERSRVNISESPVLLLPAQKFEWYSEISHQECECGLKIYKISFDKALVIVSELKDNPNCSVRKEALTLINLVCYKFGLIPIKTMWIEYDSQGYLKEEDSYHEIWLSMFYVKSKRIKQEKLEAILGIKL